MKSDFFLPTKFEQTLFKLSKAALPMSMKHPRKYLRYLRSHEDAFFHFCSANFGKFFTQVLESS